MLCHRLRLCLYIKTTLGQRLVFAGIPPGVPFWMLNSSTRWYSHTSCCTILNVEQLIQDGTVIPDDELYNDWIKLVQPTHISPALGQCVVFAGMINKGLHEILLTVKYLHRRGCEDCWWSLTWSCILTQDRGWSWNRRGWRPPQNGTCIRHGSCEWVTAGAAPDCESVWVRGVADPGCCVCPLSTGRMMVHWEMIQRVHCWGYPRCRYYCYWHYPCRGRPRYRGNGYRTCRTWWALAGWGRSPPPGRVLLLQEFFK